MRRGKIESLSQLLSEGLSGEVAEKVLWALALSRWDDILGNLTGRAAPLRLEGERLLAVADSPAVAHELNMRGGEIVKELQLIGLKVSSLHAVVGRVPRRKVARAKPAPDVTVVEEDVRAARSRVSGKIGSEDVADQLAKLLATYRKRFNR